MTESTSHLQKSVALVCQFKNVIPRFTKGFGSPFSPWTGAFWERPGPTHWWLPGPLLCPMGVSRTKEAADSGLERKQHHALLKVISDLL